MSQKGATKDEKYLLKLYEMAQERGTATREIDRYEVGDLMGQRQRGVDSIVRTLAKSNFVRLGSGSKIYLSDGGLVLIKRLRST